MQKAYARIGWENYPSDETPINEGNLNKMDVAINELDNRIINADSSKATKAEVATLVQEISFEESTGIITITKKNGSVLKIDTKMEKIAVNFSYDKTTQKIILTLIDGTKQYVDLSALITQFEFIDTDTIGFEITADGKVKATVLDGSITSDKLEPDYLADIEEESAKAEKASESAGKNAQGAEKSAKLAQSYATGGTETREGEDEDNAKYYSEQAKKALKEVQGEYVTGVKGAAETDYRKGNVSISPEDIGALPTVVISETTDFNDFKKTGCYHINYTSGSNRPTTNHGTLIVNFDVGTPFQIWIPDNKNIVYKRCYSSNNWTAWGVVNEDAYVKKTGDTMTGNLNIDTSSTNGAQAQLNLTGSYGKQGRVVSSDAGNFGLYDASKSKWMVKSDANGNVTLNGTATTATKLGSSTVGSRYKPVYINKGVVEQCAFQENPYVEFMTPSSRSEIRYIKKIHDSDGTFGTCIMELHLALPYIPFTKSWFYLPVSFKITTLSTPIIHASVMGNKANDYKGVNVGAPVTTQLIVNSNGYAVAIAYAIGEEGLLSGYNEYGGNLVVSIWAEVEN